MAKAWQRIRKLRPLRCWAGALALLFPLATSAEQIVNAGMFVSVATRAAADAFRSHEFVVADFGGRMQMPAEGIEIWVNDPFNFLGPLGGRIDFVNVPIDISWADSGRIYIELVQDGWELLYSTDLGSENWVPVGDLPQSTRSGEGWVVDLRAESKPALFRGRPID